MTIAERKALLESARAKIRAADSFAPTFGIHDVKAIRHCADTLLRAVEELDDLADAAVGAFADPPASEPEAGPATPETTPPELEA